ncbi:hypothetical protein D0Z07_5685 [Hyphodiscus hymeniophilus]|uniref:Uncharacterized protein n=1 Tax=Hyphodiscus hymeniophilus TaxID=353542 RepID=A0A9P6VHE1_9HELO|nr:hypothetical protein D0Z07_5685 [Hyphodiscus hymeniophilus]
MAESPSSFSTAQTPQSATSSMIPMYRTPTEILRSHTSPGPGRLLELKLMHHYTASTSQTLADKSAQKVAWQVNIPSIAYDAQYLMDAILAVSALHLRALNPDDQALVRASHGYMASALAQYSSLLRDGGLSEFNAEALFSTSALIAFQASASRGFDDQDQDYVLPLAWFHSFQGVKTMVMASWQWLRNSDRIFPIIGAQPAVMLDFDPDRKSFFSPLLEGMALQLLNEPDHSRFEKKQAYEHSVAFLNWAHQKPERARILGFAATVSRKFVELIGQQDPRALVIISCFFAMTRVCDDVWWLKGVAKREVTGILSLLPQEWWARMEWPLRIANHVGEMDDETWGVNSSAVSVKEEDVDVRSHIDMLAQIMNEQAPPLPPD